MAGQANQNEQEDAEMTTWLKSIKLDCYPKNFVEKGYECMEQLKDHDTHRSTTIDY